MLYVENFEHTFNIVQILVVINAQKLKKFEPCDQQLLRIL